MTPRRSLMLLLGSMAVALLVYPFDPPHDPPSEPLTMEVLSIGRTYPGSADARVRFRNRTRSPIAVAGPVDYWCICGCSGPHFGFAVRREGKHPPVITILGVLADTSHNRTVFHGGFADTAIHPTIFYPRRPLVLPPHGWRDMDVSTVHPITNLNPIAVQCVYSNSRLESRRPVPYIEPNGTFVGRVDSEPFTVPK
jgi:hypothetical protein